MARQRVAQQAPRRPTSGRRRPALARPRPRRRRPRVGARSPPIASTATRIRRQPPAPAGGYSSFDRAHLASAVVAAVRAHLVRRLRLVALRAHARAPRASGRRASGAWRSACLGVSSFWIRHAFSRLLEQRASSTRQPRVHPRRPRTRTSRVLRFVPHSGTARGSPRGTAASSAPPGRTAPASAGRGRSRCPVERRRQVVVFDLASPRRPASSRVRQVEQVERLVDRHLERLEAPAARQLERRPHRARPGGTASGPCDVERQGDRRRPRGKPRSSDGTASARTSGRPGPRASRIWLRSSSKSAHLAATSRRRDRPSIIPRTIAGVDRALGGAGSGVEPRHSAGPPRAWG